MTKKKDYEYTGYNLNLIEHARDLRKNMTEEERKLWYCFLRHYPVKFVRQRPIGNYIADFYCARAKLVVEIDGIQHYVEAATKYDIKRTRAINRLGVEVIRFSNDEINKEFEEVCHAIDVVVKEKIQNSDSSV